MNYGRILKAKLDSGCSLEEALLHLRMKGASPLDVARALVTTKGVHPGEAKRMLTKPGAWKGVRQKVDGLHRKVLERVRKASGGRENPPGKST